MPKKQPKPGGKFKHRTLIRDATAILQDEWGWNVAIDSEYSTDAGQAVKPDIVAIPPDALKRRGEKLGWLEFQTANIREKSIEAVDRFYDGLNRTFTEPLIIDVSKVWDDSTAKRFGLLRAYFEMRYPKWRKRL